MAVPRAVTFQAPEYMASTGICLCRGDSMIPFLFRGPMSPSTSPRMAETAGHASSVDVTIQGGDHILYKRGPMRWAMSDLEYGESDMTSLAPVSSMPFSILVNSVPLSSKGRA